MGLSIPSTNDGSGEGERAYSRTADAESVVLNFANVLTYSRVLLYTLKEGREGAGISAKKRERDCHGWANNDAHCVRSVFVPVFEQVLDLRD